MTELAYRKAKISDSQTIVDFITKLAIYEKMDKYLEVTKEKIEKWIFKEKLANVILLTVDGKTAGFALYFYNFSTFLGKPGIFLEDVYIDQEYRNLGLGKIVFKYLTDLAMKEEVQRVEWNCLDWNEPSIKFYEKLGAKNLTDKLIFRLDTKAIKKLNERLKVKE